VTTRVQPHYGIFYAARSATITPLQWTFAPPFHAPPEEREPIAFAITAMIDGIWLAGGLRTGGLDRERALEHLEFQLDRLIPTAGPDRDEKVRARQRVKPVYEILATAA